MMTGGSLIMYDIDNGSLKETTLGMNCISAAVHVDEKTGDVYLSAVWTQQDDTVPNFSGWIWTDKDLNRVVKEMCNTKVNTEWNWQEADVYCRDDLILTAFPEKTSINYTFFDHPWE